MVDLIVLVVKDIYILNGCDVGVGKNLEFIVGVVIVRWESVWDIDILVGIKFYKYWVFCIIVIYIYNV